MACKQTATIELVLNTTLAQDDSSKNKNIVILFYVTMDKTKAGKSSKQCLDLFLDVHLLWCLKH